LAKAAIAADETALAAQVALRDLSFQRLYLASQIIEAAIDEDLEGGGAVFEQPEQQGEDGESCADDWNHTADDAGDGTDRLESTDEIFLVRRRHANAVKDIVEFIAALRVITVRKGFGEAAERLCQGVEIDGKPPARGAIHRLARHGSVGQHTAAVHVKATTQIHAEFRHGEDFPDVSPISRRFQDHTEAILCQSARKRDPGESLECLMRCGG
jgi:hypothetical protein